MGFNREDRTNLFDMGLSGVEREEKLKPVIAENCGGFSAHDSI